MNRRTHVNLQQHPLLLQTLSQPQLEHHGKHVTEQIIMHKNINKVIFLLHLLLQTWTTREHLINFTFDFTFLALSPPGEDCSCFGWTIFSPSVGRLCRTLIQGVRATQFFFFFFSSHLKHFYSEKLFRILYKNLDLGLKLSVPVIQVVQFFHIYPLKNNLDPQYWEVFSSINITINIF